MTISPQSFALVVAMAFVFGVLIGGIGALAIAMRAVKHAEGVGYDR